MISGIDSWNDLMALKRDAL